MREQFDIDATVFSDYLIGVASPQNREIVERWIAQDATRRQWVAELQSAANFNEPPALDLEALYGRIAQQTGVSSLGPVDANSLSRRAFGWPWIHGSQHRITRSVWATPLALTCGIALLIAGWRTQVFRANAASAMQPSIYATANGERATVTLPDGSVAVLNVASRIEVPADYSGARRTVKLSGEALFTVTHAAGAPFTVIAGPSTTRVLGTKFSVRYYAADSNAVVAVREGKVAVQSVILTAGQQVAVGQGGSGIVQHADSTRFSFASGALVLNGIPLWQAIPELNRWYNAEIRLANTTLAERRITGGFHAGSLADFAAILELTFPDIQVVRAGRILTIVSR